MRLVSLTSFQFCFASAKLADEFNTRIARTKSCTSGVNGCIYAGGTNKGVMVRTPDFFDGSPPAVVPATLWHNDILTPSQIYPTVASPWCPFEKTDGYFDQGTCSDDPWKYAAVGYVMASSMWAMFDDFDHIQDQGWNKGVFYASDANAADKRCIYRSDLGGYDCPGGTIKGGKWRTDQKKSGSGGYKPGNPDLHGNRGSTGGGAGCHVDGHAIDQTDAYNYKGENLVMGDNCQCNSNAYRASWGNWVSVWSRSSQQKSGFESRNWLDGSGNLAPAWGVDTAACWLNNPRDMIALQNELWLGRENWNNQLIPRSKWYLHTSEEIRKYWGWNEIPISGDIAQDATSWDAIVVKLPADVCNKNWGAGDHPSCLEHEPLRQLEADLDALVKNNKLALGVGKMGGGNHPRSDILFAKEFSQDSGRTWSREFFCENWASLNNKYKVVSTSAGCYIDHGDGPAPAPSPQSGEGDLRNQKNGLCLTAQGQNWGDSVSLGQCGSNTAHWVVENGQIKYNSLCLDGAAEMQQSSTLFLWECNGLPQQQWTLHNDGSLSLPNSQCLDGWGDNSNGAGVQLWECNSLNNQKWTLPTATETMV